MATTPVSTTINATNHAAAATTTNYSDATPNDAKMVHPCLPLPRTAQHSRLYMHSQILPYFQGTYSDDVPEQILACCMADLRGFAPSDSMREWLRAHDVPCTPDAGPDFNEVELRLRPQIMNAFAAACSKHSKLPSSPEADETVVQELLERFGFPRQAHPAFPVDDEDGRAQGARLKVSEGQEGVVHPTVKLEKASEPEPDLVKSEGMAGRGISDTDPSENENSLAFVKIESEVANGAGSDKKVDALGREEACYARPLATWTLLEYLRKTLCP
ncbi:hypothetical protein CLAFUW4_14836 [Fulvia fulva]|nr:hypothetical protein CLAFUR0_14829 [Fulvia fulva]WPV23020.1 hypothetical protein CLAFUW4_14836 [Fulvia fulva]WPV37931.1 hypothetical protein CLAFUW7_14837 [Fulvia fulva]